ncbi:TetR family transcriptional regulator [Kitasatospora sp. NPDC051705]|uniref:acyl-CoA-like ligand-binding transcription factor n=1 Tax=Kitasatospora sp. NPDC051705 TaxID=3364057 RepID=UPI0037A03969
MTVRLGLWERKKNKTRQLVQREGLRLFVEQGYTNTTVDQLCAVAEISQSTFFRYFPTKEDVVFGDDYGPFLEEAISRRPVDEPVVEVFRSAVLDLLDRRVSQDRDAMLARIKLAAEVRALGTRMRQLQQEWVVALAALLAGRVGRNERDDSFRIAAAVLVAVASEVLLYWAEQDGQPDLRELFTRAMDRLADMTV